MSTWRVGVACYQVRSLVYPQEMITMMTTILLTMYVLAMAYLAMAMRVIH